MAGLKPLKAIPNGAFAYVTKVNTAGLTRRRLLDLGLVPGTRVEVVRRSPMGDPIAVKIRGAIIALRAEESGLVMVRE
ncbi:MAG: FeoA family protein [Heliobacteriaceae bacterium]|nr:FeoA family protein [Heliobacteriaceae bacterium]MDD4587916.1 FeoA family protein [Heliobacteriaceae bacterium]